MPRRSGPKDVRSAASFLAAFMDFGLIDEYHQPTPAGRRLYRDWCRYADSLVRQSVLRGTVEPADLVHEAVQSLLEPEEGRTFKPERCATRAEFGAFVKMTIRGVAWTRKEYAKRRRTVSFDEWEERPTSARSSRMREGSQR